MRSGRKGVRMDSDDLATVLGMIRNKLLIEATEIKSATLLI